MKSEEMGYHRGQKSKAGAGPFSLLAFLLGCMLDPKYYLNHELKKFFSQASYQFSIPTNNHVEKNKSIFFFILKYINIAAYVHVYVPVKEDA